MQKGIAFGSHFVTAFIQIIECLHQFPHVIGNVNRVNNGDGINSGYQIQPNVALIICTNADEPFLSHAFQINDIAEIRDSITRNHPLRVEQFAGFDFVHQV